MPPNKTDVTFLDNSAKYGPNLASYPYRIGLRKSTGDKEILLENIGSDITFETPLELILFDYDDQIMSLDNSSQLIITSANPAQGTIGGINAKTLVKGIAEFDAIKAIAKPGSTSIGYKVSSKELDQGKLQAVFNKSSAETDLIINFRY